MIGPNKNYEVSGYIEFSVVAWPNSIIITVLGYKKIQFKDG